jgi:mono/diheme cytochrome c family protein
MRNCRPNLAIKLFLMGLGIVCGIVRECPAADDAEAVRLYRETIHPVFRARCANCHGALKQTSGLRLDAIQLIRSGGAGGPSVEAGKPDKSLLLDAVLGRNGVAKMPPEGEPLKAEQIDAITKWIAAGAPGPDEPVPEDPNKHWAFQPMVRPELPPQEPGASSHPVDRWLDVARKRAGIKPVGEASKETLLRRVYLDLIGLPPSPEEQTAYLADTRPDAYERVVDDLLSRPQYGERWGRHWMDVWRYSDWDGYANEVRESQPHIWRWRDWIVENLNSDRPYDQMIVAMLAADEATPDDEAELRATGFLVRQWFKFNRNVWLDNAIEHTGKAFLGVTFNCAKCHDHFYDPIPQTDYYKLRAFFEPYDVRVDPVTGMTDPEKQGLARVFDAKLAEPTYLFTRGDEARPVKEHALSPDFPGLMRGLGESPKEVALPPVAYYPGLHPAKRALERANQARILDVERQKVVATRQALAVASKKHAALLEVDPESPVPAEFGAPKPLLQETFDTLDPARWVRLTGQWEGVDGVVRQTEVRADEARLLLNAPASVPGSFLARVKVTITGGTMWRSVGLSFGGRTDNAPFAAIDMAPANETGVYLSASTTGTVASLFQKVNGQPTYPPNGRMVIPLELNKPYELVVAVVGKVVNVAVDGKVVLVYQLPEAAQPGRLSLWTYDALADFSELELLELGEGAALAEKSGGPLPDLLANNGTAGSLERRLRAEVAKLTAQLAREELRRETLEVQGQWTEARIAADDAQYAVPPAANASDLAKSAVRLQRAALLGQRRTEEEDARQKFVAAEQAHLEKADDATKKALADATEGWKKAVEATVAALAATKVEDGDTNYAKFTPLHPATSSGRRLALARMIASPQNPLTARVAVNHVWMRHFGAPLVESVFDFGVNGRKPSHPELLDWLASEFVASGWKQKSLHRLIVTSAAYRLASTSGGDAARLAADSENRNVWKFSARRLEAEAVRDAALAVSGQLDTTQGGEELAQEAGLTVPRRSLYFRASKEKRMVFTSLFDGPNVSECYRRSESVTPQQALALANSPLARTASRQAARKVAEAHPTGEGDGVREARVEAAFRRILSRGPTADERAECVAFLAAPESVSEGTDSGAFQGAEAGTSQPATDAQLRRLEELCHVLINHHEFVTVR